MPNPELQVLDPSTLPHLSGRFAPVHTETDAADLEVEGSLPTDLVGAYVRNGPNPKFAPLGSYTYPMEGDGMLHAVWIEDGRARYRNRWVETQGLRAEERAGRALFGGIMTPAFVDQSLLGNDHDPGWPLKLDAFINVVRHGGRHLALEEGTPPYEVTSGMETVGRYDFSGGLPDGMTAHPRIDPVTGEMVVFRYDLTEPYLTWAAIAADGTVARPATVVPEVDRSIMVHDFTITEHYVVFVMGPAVFDLDALTSGGSLLQYRPELGTRVLLVPRDGLSPTVTFELEAFWVWHFANAYEEAGPDGGTRVVVDFPWWGRLGLAVKDEGPAPGAFSRLVLDAAGGSHTLTHLDELKTEFPRIDDRLTGRPHRYLTVGGDVGAGAELLTRGEHNRLLRYDMVAGTTVDHDPRASVGEVVFAPREGSTGELDGYYLTFGTSLDDGRSALYVWDAGEFPSAPRARVLVPTRVPNGLHGNWFAGDVAPA
ncbi:MAG: carotenoid oxygenase family protein [Acidimicrobiales bacterium]